MCCGAFYQLDSRLVLRGYEPFLAFVCQIAPAAKPNKAESVCRPQSAELSSCGKVIATKLNIKIAKITVKDKKTMAFSLNQWFRMACSLSKASSEPSEYNRCSLDCLPMSTVSTCFSCATGLLNVHYQLSRSLRIHARVCARENPPKHPHAYLHDERLGQWIEVQ